MPRTDTSNLAKTTVSLARKARDTPTGDDASVTATAGSTEHIDHLVLGKDVAKGDGLLKLGPGPVNLGGDVAAVDLNLHHVSLALTKVGLLGNVRVGNHANDGTVLLHAGNLVVNRHFTRRIQLRVLGKRLLLGLVPVLVETTLKLVLQSLGPHGGEETQTVRCVNIPDNTNHVHLRYFNHGNSLDCLLLVHLRAYLINITNNMGHTRLVAHEGSEVDWRGGIVTGERLHLTTVVLRLLLREKGERAMAGSTKLTVTHLRERKE
mmetsp:Transcript_4151/g.13499  ORF Transcript_4151/g.13499 Transcript_4151/m.13499 type:complete len:264 (-) Transcript_4151:43-834(-)